MALSKMVNEGIMRKLDILPVIDPAKTDSQRKKKKQIMVLFPAKIAFALKKKRRAVDATDSGNPTSRPFSKGLQRPTPTGAAIDRLRSI